MRTGRISTAKLAEYVLDLAGTPMWLGLSSQDPFSVDDALTVEVQGTAYYRPQASWTLVAPTLLRSNSVSRWAGLVPGTRVTAVVAWTSSFNGVPLIYMPLAEPKDFPQGGTFQLPSGELYVGIDV